MKDRSQKKTLIIAIVMLVMIGIGILETIGLSERKETIQEAMRDAVVHDANRIAIPGGLAVDPSLVSGFIVTGIILFAALLLRIFVIPRFTLVPGKLQFLIEEWVGIFDRMAKSSSPHKTEPLGAYIFAAGTYIFVGTMFELFGFQAVTTTGHSIALPAPLADINGAISMGCLSYLFILVGGFVVNRMKGVGNALKEFSLPISMTFRLFGALLSGMLTTELVYHYITLSFVLPVVVGVLFTLLHAVIQAYVLTMLTSVYYGEVTE
ncbi:MAG: F0F1 ATP synthase subunit A [Lachnospiraceae bacterium]|nr:F0F1 ATP synthase subunit A [Lachnospiraceae bacterium]